jgi:hypothetical protein
MRISLLSAVVMWALIGCGVQGQGDELQGEVAQAATVTLTGVSCAAHSSCAAPYDGREKTCTGKVSCQPFADHVTCDGISTYCVVPPPPPTCSNTCDPITDCCIQSSQGCWVPSSGPCA